MLKKSVFVLMLVASLMSATWVQASVKIVEQSFESAPHQVVQDTTVKVLAALESGLDPVKEPEKFVEELSSVLNPVVAFDYIAKGVMGVYAKKASKEQVKQFATAFKFGLVNQYGKGMALFSDLEVAVLPPAKPLGDQRRVGVTLEIRGASSKNQATFTMAKNRKGQWKMINLVLNGANFGESMKNQFAAAVEKNKGDVSKTITEWGKG